MSDFVGVGVGVGWGDIKTWQVRLKLLGMPLLYTSLMDSPARRLILVNMPAAYSPSVNSVGTFHSAAM